MLITLLLVEDTPTGAARARRLLKDFDILVSKFGRINAIQDFERMRTAGREPQVVVTNLSIEDKPEEGISLIRELRRIAPDCIIVAWTKHSQRYRSLALKAGADAAYAKYMGDDRMSTDILGMLADAANPAPNR